MKKGTTRKEKKRLVIISIMILGLLSVLVGSVFKDFLQIIDNNKQIASLSTNYENLLTEEEELSKEVKKLQDPEYIAKYAKEKYMYSSDGELIIRMN